MITTERPDTTRSPERPVGAVARQARHLVVVTLVTAVAALVALVALANAPSLRGLSIGYLVFLAGAGGGVAANYRRLQRLLAQTTTTTDDDDRRLVTYQVYLSPVIGGVFALLLYGIFMSGTLVQGGLAPEFACAQRAYVDLDGLAACAPTTHADVAKALVWSFAAGFVEMLVPNFISTLTRSVDHDPDR
jgi:hypothetical protein